MARTLTEIQASVRFHARDNGLVLTDTSGLLLANRVFRKLVLSFEWPEYYVEDVTLTTIAGTSRYTWPTNAPASVLRVEVQGTHNGGTLFGSGVFGQDLFGAGEEKYRGLAKPPSELAWERASLEPDSDWPWYYRRRRESTTNQLEIRPAPAGAKPVRISGLKEPTDFAVGTDSTIFIDSASDDALEYLIAAQHAFRAGAGDLVLENKQQASAILTDLFNQVVEV